MKVQSDLIPAVNRHCASWGKRTPDGILTRLAGTMLGRFMLLTLNENEKIVVGVSKGSDELRLETQ